MIDPDPKNYDQSIQFYEGTTWQTNLTMKGKSHRKQKICLSLHITPTLFLTLQQVRRNKYTFQSMHISLKTREPLLRLSHEKKSIKTKERNRSF